MSSTSARAPGELYRPFDTEQRENPYAFYALLRHEEPVAYNPELGVWLVTRYSDVRFVLSQPDIFSSRDVTRPLTNLTPATSEILRQGYPMTSTAISSDGTKHQRFRAPYLKTFSPARAAGHRAFVVQVAERLADAMAARPRTDIISEFAYPLTLEVILHVMGVPEQRMADAQRWSRALIAFLYSPLSEERQAECARGLVAFQHYIAELIAARRQEPREDAISDMVHSQLPGAEPLSLNEMVSALCGLLMAGHKTTIDLIGNGLGLLLNPPARWQALCARPEHIPTMVEEVLRYDSPVQALSRTTTCDVMLGGVSLPAGAKLLLLFASANRDAEQFPDADQFDIARASNHHLGFGYGAHFCVGAPLARLEGRVAFEVLTRRFPSLRLVPGQALAHLPILAFRGYQCLEVEQAQWP